MIRLYTPVPPARTGTADYAGFLLDDLLRAGVGPGDLELVLDPEGVEALPDAPGAGFPAISVRDAPRVVRTGETAVFFIANNEHHAYIHRALREVAVERGGRLIAVIHEPCCAMLLESLAAHRRHGFDDRILVDLFAAQHGERAIGIIADYRARRLPDLALFTTHALGHVLEKADEVWTHSAFAAMKLALESVPPAARLPRFRVVAHPDDPAGRVASPDPADAADFVVGLFGWVARPKRVLEALEGFRRFVDTLAPGDRARVRLRIVGALPPADVYDPRKRASALGIADLVDFYDFVDGESFRRLLAGVRVLLNLRFPSCGETSGTLHHGLGRGAVAIATDYQAFRESGADALIGFQPGDEIAAIASRLGEQFAAWSGTAPKPAPRRPPALRRQRIDALIAGLADMARGPVPCYPGDDPDLTTRARDL